MQLLQLLVYNIVKKKIFRLLYQTTDLSVCELLPVMAGCVGGSLKRIQKGRILQTLSLQEMLSAEMASELSGAIIASSVASYHEHVPRYSADTNGSRIVITMSSCICRLVNSIYTFSGSAFLDFAQSRFTLDRNS